MTFSNRAVERIRSRTNPPQSWYLDLGLIADYDGSVAPREQDGCHVYRIDPASGAVTRVAGDFHHPNGLAFSRDEKFLFIADSGATEEPAAPRHIRKLAVNTDGGGLSSNHPGKRGMFVLIVCTLMFWGILRYRGVW